MPTLARLDARTAFVTGGASGIGAATAARLAAEGAQVVVGDVDLEGARVVAKAIGGTAVRLDVVDLDSVRDAFAAATGDVGPIDVLVNNAGADCFGFFVASDPATWDHVLRVNLNGTMACTHAVAPSMLERRRGSIVNVASEAGVVGCIGGAAYSASKAAVLGFTKTIARELAPFGVRANSVAPGPIDTPMLAALVEDNGPKGAMVRQAMIDATALRRMGTPDEVAAAIAFLASDDAGFITGHTLSVSGGISMQ